MKKMFVTTSACLLISLNVFADKLLVIENSSDLISAYNIDQYSGQLSKQSQGGTVGHGPADIMISPDGKYLFVINDSSSNITRYNINDIKNNQLNNGQLVADIGVGTWGGTFTPDGKGLLVSATEEDKFNYFTYNKDSGALNKRSDITLNNCPGGFGMTFAPNTDAMYLMCYKSNAIAKFRYSSANNSYVEQKLITLGNGHGIKPRGIMFDSKNNKAYISSEGSSVIYVYSFDAKTGDIGSPITQITTNFGLLVGVSFDPYGYMVARDRNTGTLNYYKQNSSGIYTELVRSCHLGKPTLGSISFDNNGHMYAITRSDNSVSVYNTYPDKCPHLMQNLTTVGVPFGLVRITM